MFTEDPAAPRGNSPKAGPPHSADNKAVHCHGGSGKKNTEVSIRASKRVNFENVMPSERSLTQKVPCGTIPFMCHVQIGKSADRKQARARQGLGEESRDSLLVGFFLG